jgi:hypothetical protein
MSMKRFRSFLWGMCLLAGNVAAQEGFDMRYLVRHGAVTLGANPIPASTRTAFYTARGFTAQQIRPYSEACGFSFGLQNGGKTPILSRLADWRAVGADSKVIAFKLPEAWEAAWQTDSVPQAARIAFKWAQFQAENALEPGDWIMGMATLDSVPKAPFRLVARYHDNKGDHEIVLDKLECARD